MAIFLIIKILFLIRNKFFRKIPFSLFLILARVIKI